MTVPTSSAQRNLGLTIVIPAHNEARRISPMLNAYLEHFGQRAHFILVLNACTDDTHMVVETIVNALGAQSVVTIVDISQPIGKAGAVYEGFRQAQTPYVGFVDADGSTAPYEYERLFHEMGNADGIIASRRMPHSHVANRTVGRRFISWSFATVARVLLRMPFHDTQCGAKIFRTALVKSILPKLTIRNSAFDLDLLLKLQQAGATLKEEPTYWVDNSSSTMFTSPRQLLTASWDMYRSVKQLARIRHHTSHHG